MSEFTQGVNSMSVIVLSVLKKRGLTNDQALVVVNESLEVAQRQLNGEDVVVITKSHLGIRLINKGLNR